MGLLGNMRLATWIGDVERNARPQADMPYPSESPGYARLAIASPWGPNGNLGHLPDPSEIWGAGAYWPLDREAALSIPGVARGRGILLSLIADKPFVDYVGGDRAPVQPNWLYRTPGWQGPWQRMARSVDDHIFYGDTLWGCKRGAASSGLKPILEAWHIPYDLWQIDALDRICVMGPDGQFVVADESEVIYIPAAHDGLLAYAQRSLRGAIELESAWIGRAKNPIPAIDLHETNDTGMERDERQTLVNDWASARGDVNGTIASTPYNIDARVLGSVDPEMFIGARNASRLDIANFFQIPAALMDATTATASLTYTTQDSAQNSVDTMTVPYWIRPYEDRLSQDDILPIGHIVRVAWASAYTEPPGPINTGIAGAGPVVDAAATVVGEAVGTAVADRVTGTDMQTEETP